MIFQEPMTSLNPVFTVGEQIAESLRLHKRPGPRGGAARRPCACWSWWRSRPPRSACDEYPHQLSGGMRQRVMIALAMACDPTLLIADEPTTALDVTIQAQILALMRRLQAETGMSILFITHNLGVVAHHADDVAVMYAGRIVEAAPVRPLFAAPQHPYTQGLLACLPGKAHARRRGRGRSACSRSAARCRARWRRRRAAPSSRAATRPSARCRAGDAAAGRHRRRPAGALHPRAGGRPRRRRPEHARCSHRTADVPLIEVRDLKRYFGSKDKPVRAVDGVSFAIQPRRDARPGRRIGLGQEHDRPHRAAPARLHRRPGAVPRRRHRRAVERAHAQAAPQAADHLPGPVREPEPEDARRRASSARRWPRTACTRARARRRSASPSCSSWSACAPSTPAASRTSSPAASASASASRARWRSSPSSSSPTSRCRRSTCRSRRR